MLLQLCAISLQDADFGLVEFAFEPFQCPEAEYLMYLSGILIAHIIIRSAYYYDRSDIRCQGYTVFISYLRGKWLIHF